MYIEKMKAKQTLTSDDVNSIVSAMKTVFPTKSDVEQIVTTKIDEKIKLLPTWASFDEKFKDIPTRAEMEELIKNLPTKEEFFSRMDQLSGEYQKIDEAETLHTGTLSAHEETLEKHDERIKALERRKASTPTPISSIS